MKCDGCTVCCRLFPVRWLGKKALQPCKYAEDGFGCHIHANRDVECSGFSCMYFQSDKIDEDLRPDRCHVVFEKITYDIIWGTKDPNHEITDKGKRQIDAFVRQGFSVVIGDNVNSIQYALTSVHTIEYVKRAIIKKAKNKWLLTEQT